MVNLMRELQLVRPGSERLLAELRRHGGRIVERGERLDVISDSGSDVCLPYAVVRLGEARCLIVLDDAGDVVEASP